MLWQIVTLASASLLPLLLAHRNSTSASCSSTSKPRSFLVLCHWQPIAQRLCRVKSRRRSTMVTCTLPHPSDPWTSCSRLDVQCSTRVSDAFVSSALQIYDNSLGSPPAEMLLHELRPDYWFSAHLHVKFAAKVDHPPSADSGGAAGSNGSRKSTRFLALDKCLPRRGFLQASGRPFNRGFLLCQTAYISIDGRIQWGPRLSSAVQHDALLEQTCMVWLCSDISQLSVEQAPLPGCRWWTSRRPGGPRSCSTTRSGWRCCGARTTCCRSPIAPSRCQVLSSQRDR